MSRSICGGLERTFKDLEIVFKTLLSVESRGGVTKYASAEVQEKFSLFCSASDELRNLIPTDIVTSWTLRRTLVQGMVLNLEVGINRLDRCNIKAWHERIRRKRTRKEER